MKIKRIDYMIIDFETLKKIYLNSKRMKTGTVKHYEIWTGKFNNPSILQVMKLEAKVK